MADAEDMALLIDGYCQLVNKTTNSIWRDNSQPDLFKLNASSVLSDSEDDTEIEKINCNIHF